LVARKLHDGVLFYFAYKHRGKAKRFPLGPFDPDGRRGYSLQQARDRSAELAKVYRTGDTDIHGYVRHQVSATIAAREAAEQAAARELRLAQQGNLKRLLELYVEHLEKQGKVSARDVRSAFRHVPAELAQRRASALGMGDFLEPIRALVDAGKGRMAGVLRAYLRAAYQLAVDSQSEPEAAEALRSLGVTHNPVADVSSKGLRQFRRARTRALNAHELGTYVGRLEALPDGVARDALLLSLYLGGQRMQQLLRLEHPDVDLPARTLMLLDRKGSRVLPRVHVLPVVPQIMPIVERLVSAARLVGELCVWGSTSRKTLTTAVARISDAMVAAGEAREPFELRDVRRTCETMMASLKVSKDVRAQIQSHGLAGVQDRHYDRHDYLKEKRSALLKLAKHLETLEAQHRARAEARASGQAD
jgi:hypothetical protein